MMHANMLLAAFRPITKNLKPFAIYLAVSLGITLLSRVALGLWFGDRVTAASGWIYVLVQGFRYDLIVQGMLLFFPLVLTPVFCAFAWSRRTWSWLLPSWLALCTIFIFFMELATPWFIDEYGLRPNILFVKYLIYPNEVMAMLWSGYKLPIFIAALTIPLLTWFVFRAYRCASRDMQRNGLLPALVVVPLLMLVCAVAIRSSFAHRPANPSNIAISNDPLVNMLPLSSAYSVLYGAYEMRYEPQGVKFGDIPMDAVIANMRGMMGAQSDAFIGETLPTLRRQWSPVSADGPANLVIVLEESLGARFVGSLGGLPLTPNLDRYSSEGIWFTQMHATGTRSVRGIEAVITGFLPTTTESVVKLGGTQRGFFTIADLLQRHGYSTSFIYGGSAQFDNMRRFFVNNGFETVIDRANYENPQFEGSWGVSDEDLFRKADAYFDSLPADKPFFSLVFTSSNHTPFEYPAGAIEPYNEPAQTRENAIKYADHALGSFIELAKQSEYWGNTVFLIVADHDSRVLGAQLVPIRHYRVPALILGADIEPQTVTRLASQVDLIPTLLPLLGLGQDVVHPATGINLLGDNIENIPPHAVMQYGNNIAYREIDGQSDNVIIFQENREPQQFRYENEALIPAPLDEGLLEIALSHVEWPRLAYKHKWYRLPETSVDPEKVAVSDSVAPAPSVTSAEIKNAE
ncbi:MAG TPA: LTA synthase family protein [Gammaproteobacteria bacterium]